MLGKTLTLHLLLRLVKLGLYYGGTMSQGATKMFS